MKTSQQLHRYRLIKSVTEKLHPKRFPKMSGRMAAVVAFLIDQQVTRPTLIEIVVTSDHFVLAGLHDEVVANHLLCRYADLVRHGLALLPVARLTRHD